MSTRHSPRANNTEDGLVGRVLPANLHETSKALIQTFCFQVLEYLNKKGYNRTEAMLRKESANQDADGRPIVTRAEDRGGGQYEKAFELLRAWIEDNLELYKVELRRLLWPIFVYSYLEMHREFYQKDAGSFFSRYKDSFIQEHDQDTRQLSTISLPEHVADSHIANIYRGNKYRLTLSNMAFNSLIQYLESKEREGGSVIIGLMNKFMNIITQDRTATGNERSLAAMIARGSVEEDLPAEDEGIPGHNPGSANTDRNAPPVLAKLQLGALPMESDLMEDVRAELQEEDSKNPPRPGQSSLMDEFEQRIKRESSEEAPTRETVPLPPSLARDVLMEVQKVKENRDRFKIEGRTGGVGPGVSVCMFTFHNTFDSINCLDFSGDNEFVAAGMQESYVRVWSLNGNALPSVNPNDKPSASKRLIGHSGPIYAVSFSPSTANPASGGPSTRSKYLLSSSADKTIRLWSLETWTCVTAYKSHSGPIWDVKWGPFGHYFLTGSLDRTARLWTTDHIAPHRLYVGHDNDVDCVEWHPNGAYVFTASSDKTVRMWHINGNPLRMFTGHTSNITALACSPSGKKLASADDSGNIIIWDIAAGLRIKRMRGHSKGGIWSLSWSVESSVIISGGADGTVRVWDVLQETPETQSANGKVIAEGGSGTKVDGGGASGSGAANKKKAKDVVVTADQISAFPTKKSPVYKVEFTRMNLVLAGGAYMP
ncbi:Transcription initiation factor TFIID subunit 5 [Diplodia seriata]|uniref:Transcription initiation factor TFIID subunit 5 n=1 Tax=Diplodia seriata TaxID=420778 RepID=A0A1S8BEG3_9PEZI|nr:Transcription initiation factor TFIID subunit 5 [Diplodia seriata]